MVLFIFVKKKLNLHRTGSLADTSLQRSIKSYTSLRHPPQQIIYLSTQSLSRWKIIAYLRQWKCWPTLCIDHVYSAEWILDWQHLQCEFTCFNSAICSSLIILSAILCLFSTTSQPQPTRFSTNSSYNFPTKAKRLNLIRLWVETIWISEGRFWSAQVLDSVTK